MLAAALNLNKWILPWACDHLTVKINVRFTCTFNVQGAKTGKSTNKYQKQIFKKMLSFYLRLETKRRRRESLATVQPNWQIIHLILGQHSTATEIAFLHLTQQPRVQYSVVGSAKKLFWCYWHLTTALVKGKCLIILIELPVLLS